jgi:deoxyribose-phosphate aldolase
MTEASKDLAAKIDHTLLRPDLSLKDIQQTCADAAKWECASVCIPPYFTREAKRILTQLGSKTKVSAVVGFPMGYSAIAAKSEEIKRATDDGADEIDAVLNILAVRNGAWNHVQNEIDLLVRAAHMKGTIMKLIVEAGLLTDDELKQVCQIAGDAKIDFVKSSTGFNGPGASVEMIKKLRAYCDPKIQIKASGGIKTTADALALIKAGADRLGCSSTAQILNMP